MGRGLTGAVAFGEVFLGAVWLDRLPVAVCLREHLACDGRPAHAVARRREVVRAIGRVTVDQEEDRACHVLREGEASNLVIDDGHLLQCLIRIRHAVGQRHHRLHEIVAVADYPARAQDVVLRRHRHRDVSRGLRLAIYAQRGEGLVLIVHLGHAVEHIVGADVH